MSKRVYLYAYTQLNLGDDLFVKILCDRYPGTKFYIMCNKRSAVALNKIANLTVIPSVPLIDRVFRRFKWKVNINYVIQKFVSKSCDAVVNIGGSIFIQDKNWRDTATQYEKRTREKPFFVMGSNFGPYADKDYLERYKTIFKSVEDVCFRDSYSYDLFSSLPNVRYASDIVFSYPAVNNENKKKQIVISVIDLNGRKELKRYDSAYKQKIIDLSREFVKMGYSVILMGFCGNQGDEKAIEQILNQLNDKERVGISAHNYSGNLEGSLKIIGESEFMIATRFHAMILGWVFELPVYSLLYSKKSLNVIKDIGSTDNYTKIQQIEDIEVKSIINSLIDSKPLDIKQQVSSARSQFRELDELLSRSF